VALKSPHEKAPHQPDREEEEEEAEYDEEEVEANHQRRPPVWILFRIIKTSISDTESESDDEPPPLVDADSDTGRLRW
jgi:hypothetical protein